MNPQTVILVLSLIERTVKLAPEVAQMIADIKAGKEITPEEIEAIEKRVNAAVDSWEKAEDQG